MASSINLISYMKEIESLIKWKGYDNYNFIIKKIWETDLENYWI